MFRPANNPNDSKANYYYGIIVIVLLIYLAIYSLTK